MNKIPGIIVTLLCALAAVIAFDLVEYRLALQRMGTEPVCYGRLNNKIECPTLPGADMDYFPPPEYDYLFPGPIVITRKANLDELNKACGGYRRLIGACGARMAYTCQIFMLPNDKLADFAMSFRGTLRHEIGHCNGWPPDHPGRRHPAPPWYDIPAEQIFYGPPLVEQLIRLGESR